MRETRKPQKLGTARIALEGNGRLGEAVADVEDSEAAEASEGADGSGRWWMGTGGRGSARSSLSPWRLWGLRRTAGHRGAPRRTCETN